MHNDIVLRTGLLFVANNRVHRKKTLYTFTVVVSDFQFVDE